MGPGGSWGCGGPERAIYKEVEKATWPPRLDTWTAWYWTSLRFTAATLWEELSTEGKRK